MKVWRFRCGAVAHEPAARLAWIETAVSVATLRAFAGFGALFCDLPRSRAIHVALNALRVTVGAPRVVMVRWRMVGAWQHVAALARALRMMAAQMRATSARPDALKVLIAHALPAGHRGGFVCHVSYPFMVYVCQTA